MGVGWVWVWARCGCGLGVGVVQLKEAVEHMGECPASVLIGRFCASVRDECDLARMCGLGVVSCGAQG